MTHKIQHKPQKYAGVETKYIFGLIVGLVVLIVLFLLLKQFGMDIKDLIDKISAVFS